jgi:hypothetical protein
VTHGNEKPAVTRTRPAVLISTAHSGAKDKSENTYMHLLRSVPGVERVLLLVRYATWSCRICRCLRRAVFCLGYSSSLKMEAIYVLLRNVG